MTRTPVWKQRGPDLKHSEEKKKKRYTVIATVIAVPTVAEGLGNETVILLIFFCWDM